MSEDNQMTIRKQNNTIAVRTKKISNARKIRITQTGEEKYSPIMFATKKEVEKIAQDIANMIIENKRRSINFYSILESRNMEKYPLLCRFGGDLEKILDTDSKASQVGALTEDELDKVITVKKACASCPFAKECLAVSMTSTQTIRISKKARIIPGSNPPVSLSEYLMFGGYTPQERKVIYDRVCEIIDEYDKNSQ